MDLTVYFTINKNFDINICVFKNVPKSLYNELKDYFKNWNSLYGKNNWTLTFLSRWDAENYYVSIYDRNGSSLKDYCNKICEYIKPLIAKYNNEIIFEKNFMPLINENKLKKNVNPGDCMVNLSISLNYD